MPLAEVEVVPAASPLSVRTAPAKMGSPASCWPLLFASFQTRSPMLPVQLTGGRNPKSIVRSSARPSQTGASVGVTSAPRGSLLSRAGSPPAPMRRGQQPRGRGDLDDEGQLAGRRLVPSREGVVAVRVGEGRLENRRGVGPRDELDGHAGDARLACVLNAVSVRVQPHEVPDDRGARRGGPRCYGAEQEHQRACRRQGPDSSDSSQEMHMLESLLPPLRQFTIRLPRKRICTPNLRSPWRNSPSRKTNVAGFRTIGRRQTTHGFAPGDGEPGRDREAMTIAVL